jgi:uncharacterized protein
VRVVLYGATGRAGSRILEELVRRGHHVVAVKREEPAPPSSASTTWKIDDLSRVPMIAAILHGADAVVSAYAAPVNDSDALLGVCQRLAAAAEQSHVPRLLVVGGAGVLEVAPGVTLLESGKLPPEWVPMAAAHAKALAWLREAPVNWTYISPAAFFEPGERTGVYRTAKQSLLVNQVGESRISMEDYAIALVDELERGAYQRASFAVGW